MKNKKVGKNVKKLIKENNFSIEYVAQKIRIETQKLESKIQGEEEFTAKEIVDLINLLNISSKQCSKIFFPWK